MGTYGNDIQAAVVSQIRAEIAAIGWGQAELSERSNIPTSTLSRYLSRTAPRDIPLPAFAAIADAIGLSMVELSARAERRLEGKDVR